MLEKTGRIIADPFAYHETGRRQRVTDALRRTAAINYDPVLRTDQKQPSVDAQALFGQYWLVDGWCLLNIGLMVNADFDGGSGRWRFSLPLPSGAYKSPMIGTAFIYDVTPGTFYVAAAVVYPNSDNLFLALDGAGAVAVAAPMTWAQGDSMSLSVGYPIRM